MKLKVARGYLKAILGKRRKIGLDKIHSVAKVFGLSRFEHEYLSLMVIRDQTNDSHMRDYFSRVLNGMRHEHLSLKGSPFVEADRRSHLLGSWLYGTIIELSRFSDFKPDPIWIKSRLIDGESLSADQVVHILHELRRQKIIIDPNESDRKGALDVAISIDPFSSDDFQNYRAILEKTIQTLDHPGKYKNDSYFVLTFAADKEVQRKFEELCNQFRKAALDLETKSEMPDRIISMNLNYFNLVRDVGCGT